ncbi:MAG: histone deacetylase [Gemmatimonadota bacterium]
MALPPGHPFPMGKFTALHHLLLAEGLVREADVLCPEPAPWEDLARVHARQYLEALEAGALGRRAERVLGLPWSPALVRRSRLAVGGTVQAARLALADGVAANLAGGTHHAFPDHGEGFCVLNDVAVAIRLLVAEGRIGRALVVDLDVHQGNGTAAAFADGSGAYTFSIHGERNFPFRKERSSRDVALPDGTGDAAYLAALDQHLPQALDEARADLLFYLAGVDPAAGDRYGRLALSRDGLEARDRRVMAAAAARGLPLVLLTAGGYAPTPEATADLHAIAHRVAAGLASV